MTSEKLGELVAEAAKHVRATLLVTTTFGTYLLLTTYQEQHVDEERGRARALAAEKASRQSAAAMALEVRIRDDTNAGAKVHRLTAERDRLRNLPSLDLGLVAKEDVRDLATWRARLGAAEDETKRAQDAMTLAEAALAACTRRADDHTAASQRVGRAFSTWNGALDTDREGAAYRALQAARAEAADLAGAASACKAGVAALDSRSKSAAADRAAAETRVASFRYAVTLPELEEARSEAVRTAEAKKRAEEEQKATAADASAAKQVVAELEADTVVKLPIVDVELASPLFFNVAPGILVVAMAYLVEHVRKLQQLVRRFGAARDAETPAAEAIYPSLLAGALLGRGPGAWAASLVIAAQAPVVLLLVALESRSRGGTPWVSWAATAASVLLGYRLLRGMAHGPKHVSEARRKQSHAGG